MDKKVGNHQEAPAYTVGELIEKLKQFPSDLKVGYVHNGKLADYAHFAWISKSGVVTLSGFSGWIQEPIEGNSCPKDFDLYLLPQNPLDDMVNEPEEFEGGEDAFWKANEEYFGPIGS